MDSLLEPEDRLREEYLRAPWGELGRSATLGAVSLVCKFLLNVLNSTRVEGLDTFLDHVQRRADGQGLITVCNHTRSARAHFHFAAGLSLVSHSSSWRRLSQNDCHVTSK